MIYFKEKIFGEINCYLDKIYNENRNTISHFFMIFKKISLNNQSYHVYY